MALLSNNNVIKQHKVIENDKPSEIVTKLPKHQEIKEYNANLVSEETDEQVNQLNSLRNNILAQAQIEADELKQQAMQTGHDVGRQQGYAEGLNQGNIRATQLIEEAEKNLVNTVKTINDYTKSKQQEIVGLAIEMAQIIIKEQLTIEPTKILKILEPILLKLEEPDEFIKIKAHPHYHAALAEKLASQKRILGSLRYVLLDDTSLAIDHVVVESNETVTVVDIEAELNKFMNELKNEKEAEK